MDLTHQARGIMQLNNSMHLNKQQNPKNTSVVDNLNKKSIKEIKDKGPSGKDNIDMNEEKKAPLSEKSDYLKMISKLENRVISKTMEQEELVKMFSALEEKLVSFNPKQQVKLLDLELFSKLNIKNLDNIGETLSGLINKKETQTDLFGLLKSQDFISLLMNNPFTPEKYSSASVNQDVSKLAVV